MSWITPSSTRNYMLKDPICDWLELFSSKLSNSYKDKNIDLIVKSSQTAKLSKGFLSFLLNQGVKFEDGVVQLLKDRFKDKFIDLTLVSTLSFEEKYRQTVEAMTNGFHIIYQGTLIDNEEKLRGIPDLIVRSDIINKITGFEYLSKKEKSIPCLFSKKYHYRIIDIKFATLLLRSTGINLLNSGSVPAYKAQVYLYTKMLGKTQGYLPSNGYILGRRWKYSSKCNTKAGYSCFERLGDIDFSSFDKPVIEKAEDAVKWLRLLNSEGHTWTITTPPLCRPELYPNMSNTHDAPWRPLKEIIANKINEITLLWMCGPKNRILAHAKGIYEWTDKKCTTGILGVNGKKTKRVLENILQTNKESRLFSIRPRIIESNYKNWKNTDSLEVYIDFETIGDIFNNFSNLPRQESFNYITIIGSGVIIDKVWKYRSFIITDFNLNSERSICRNFKDYIVKLAEDANVKKVRLVHWSHAEPISWERASDNCPIRDMRIFMMNNERGITFEFFDLLALFKTVPITIKGCLNFGLKTIAKRLYEYGHIKTTWKENTATVDGLTAMLSSYNANLECQNSGKRLDSHPLMIDQSNYNEVDCKVLYEIITYLRENHTSAMSDSDVDTQEDTDIISSEFIRTPFGPLEKSFNVDGVNYEVKELKDIDLDRPDQKEFLPKYNLRDRKKKRIIDEINDPINIDKASEKVSDDQVSKESKEKKRKIESMSDSESESDYESDSDNEDVESNEYNYFDTDYSILVNEISMRLSESVGKVNKVDSIQKIEDIIKKSIEKTKDTLNSEYLGVKPSDKRWKLGLGKDIIDKLSPVLKEFRKIIDDEKPTMVKILEAKISKENKKLAIELFDILNNLEPYTQDYLNLRNRINKILSESIMSEKEENLRAMVINFDSIKERIFSLNSDDTVKASLYKMYNDMQNYPEDSNVRLVLDRKLRLALSLPYRNIKELPKDNIGDNIGNFLTRVHQKLDKDLYGMKNVKEELLSMLNEKLRGTRSRSILGLKGIPGVGKTTIVKAFADAVGLPFKRISVAGSEDPSIFKGNNTVWEGCGPSIILQTLAEFKCCNGIIFIDEVDKLAVSDKGRAVQYALLPIVDYSQNFEFYDDFIPEISHNLSELLFIFAMNDDTLIDPTLKDRLYIIDVPSYNFKELYTISRDYVIPKLLYSLDMKEGDIILTEDGFNSMINIYEYNKLQGVRFLESMSRKLISRLRLLMSLHESPLYKQLSFTLRRKPSLPIKIDNALIKMLLNSKE